MAQTYNVDRICRTHYRDDNVIRTDRLIICIVTLRKPSGMLQDCYLIWHDATPRCNYALDLNEETRQTFERYIRPLIEKMPTQAAKGEIANLIKVVRRFIKEYQQYLSVEEVK